ncbi:MAG: NmrA family NAD(P)-binding protein [Tomitella sp.]|nr:NmrA family NAD(P)-binding protein [Tomitella sp.]
MTILVTGSTGTVGTEVTRHLVAAGEQVRALTRNPEAASFPPGVTPVRGELTDVDSFQAALDGVSGLFLLSPVSLEELTGTLIALDLAHRAGLANLVYLSVIHADSYSAPPHFAAKAAAERLIAELELPATILRPGYYMQNDAEAKDSILSQGLYTPPVGNKAVFAVDTRDLGEVAARALLRRQEAPGRSPRRQTLDVVAPDVLTGDSIAAIWAETLNRPVGYGGDDLDGFENQMQSFMPGWMAYDLRLMMRSFQIEGMSAAPGDEQVLQGLLGRPMRSYREFAQETAQKWAD